MTPILVSTVICPHCGSPHEARMAEDSCQISADCPACGKEIRPKAGQCCIFCSWGSAPCPPVQLARARGDDRG
jgi:hypothetical protein